MLKLRSNAVTVVSRSFQRLRSGTCNPQPLLSLVVPFSTDSTTTPSFYSSLSSDINLAFNEQVPKTSSNIAQMTQKFDEIMSRIRSIDVSDASIPQALVYEICYFMTQYHTTQALNFGSTAATDSSGSGSTGVLELKLSQKKDLSLAWALLSNSMQIKYSSDSNADSDNSDTSNSSSSSSGGSNSLSRSNIDILKVEIATRLEDSLKLENAFIELLSKQPSDTTASREIASLLSAMRAGTGDEDALQNVLTKLSNDELMIAFTTAPYLGHWRVMGALGRIINDTLVGAFDSLYAMSLELPIPDFTAVYDLVAQNELFEQNGQQNGQQNGSQWGVIEIGSIRMRFQDVRCFDVNRADGDEEILSSSSAVRGGSRSETNVLVPNEERRNEMLEGISEEQRGWTDVDLNEAQGLFGKLQSAQEEGQGCSLRQMGALMSAKSFYSYGDMIPVTLYGPKMDGIIHVKGRIEIPIFAQEIDKKDANDAKDGQDEKKSEEDGPDVVMLHEEEWKLERLGKEGSRNYVGTYTIRQRPMIPKTGDEMENGMDEERVEKLLAKYAPMDWVYDLDVKLK